MKPPRFTVRRLMIVVTLLGIGFGFPIGVIWTSDIRYQRSNEHFEALTRMPRWPRWPWSIGALSATRRGQVRLAYVLSFNHV
jgi:hypothetical protein